nr:16S rRNA (guanine(966)-N(2))-methyltransferase RsmD [Luteimonas aestuarii]
MRIIGGRWRGSRLPVADADGLRPTSDRARETLFNWLQPVLPGARVLDLFAGSGALGFEAVSRGAREAALVERDPTLCASLRDSATRLQAGDAIEVVCIDALRFLRDAAAAPFDLAFVDPPFAEDAWGEVLCALPAAMAAVAWLYVESTPQCNITPGEGWQLHREGRTRDAAHRLYRRGA